MAKALTQCPVCAGTLAVSELACDRCSAQVRARFEPCRFCRLPGESLAFLETFLLCEGNLSRVGEELGLSYPTVRNRLTAALSAFRALEPGAAPALPAPDPEALARRRVVLDQVAQGEISAEAAAELLRG